MSLASAGQAFAALLVALVAAVAAGCAGARPLQEGNGIRASTDRRVIERGRYLVRGPGHCAACHGDPAREAERREGVEVPLSGGRTFDLGIAGSIVAPNITNDVSHGIGAVSDETLAQSLRYGVSREGRPLAPYMSLADVSDEDLSAIISYLRSQPPAAVEQPPSRWSVVGVLGRSLVLRSNGPVVRPPKQMVPARTPEYGRYLAHSVANCNGCHTRRSYWTGAFVGTPFAGGMHFREAAGDFVAPDLRPDGAGPMRDCTEEQFIARFRIEGRGRAGSPMPWENYARMTDDDLGAIYRYLRSLAPVT